MAYRKLEHSDDNLRFGADEDKDAGQYTVRVPRNETGMAKSIEQLIEECNTLYLDEKGNLPRIHFDRHLYQPLLVEAKGISSSPPGLRESERKFVSDLKEHLAGASDELHENNELFLLRNLTRGKGIGFFETSGFFPDFILWIKTEAAQRIVFIEPHGMIYENAYEDDEKAQLHERLPALARDIAIRSGGPNVELDSFIVSATKYQDLKKRNGYRTWTIEDFADKHILFQEREDYIARIFRS